MPLNTAELSTRVDQIRAIFSTILNDATVWNGLGAEKQQQLTTGVNKAFGQAMGFLHEYTTTQAAQAKARTVVTQTHGDVTVGAADELFAKTSECKSVTKPEKGAVNKVMGDALNQLAGNTGHNPRAGDVRVVDIRIEGDYNPWPMPGGTYGAPRSAQPTTTLQHNAEQEVLKLFNAGGPGVTPLITWLNGENFGNTVPQAAGRLNSVSKPFPNAQNPLQSLQVRPNPNSSRPVVQDAHGQIGKVRCVTIKVRYSAGYEVSGAASHQAFTVLSEIIVQVYKKAQTGILTVETAKLKTSVYDLTDLFAPPQTQRQHFT